MLVDAGIFKKITSESRRTEVIDDMTSRYNGGLDIRIHALCLYEIEKWSHGGSTDRNDPPDLWTYAYLRADDPQQVLVSNDNAQIRRLQKGYPDRGILLGKFLETLSPVSACYSEDDDTAS
jgi:hypothetical protein